jgi:hypothetical protein
MSFSYVSARGIAETKTTGTTVPVSITGDIPLGALVIVCGVCDNLATVQGATTAISVSDSQGNAYTRIAEYTRTDGSAADGIIAGYFYSILTTALTVAAVDTVTVTTPEVDAKAIGIHQFSCNGIDNIAGENEAFGTGTNPSVTLGSLDSGEYLWLGLVGWEGKSNEAWTEDADYTAYGDPIGSVAGNAATCASLQGGWRIFTGTTDTYAPTKGASNDYVAILVALEESAAESASVSPSRQFLQV